MTSVSAGAWRPTIAVPARNEAERLPRLLAALAAQTWLQAPGRILPVSLVLNNCTDRSLEAARRAQAQFPQLRLDVADVTWTRDAHVGRARRMAMDGALAQAGSPSQAVVLTTDADAEPEALWIDATLCAIAAGADAVGGLIIGDPGEEARLPAGVRQRATLQMQYATMRDRLASLIDPLPHDPWPRHHDHTGASLAVRGEVYLAVGGLPAAPFREDLGLVSRIRERGFKLVHPMDVRVGVSARLQGRAPGGMADCLRQWIFEEERGEPQLVEAPDVVRERLERRRRLRDGSAEAPARIERSAADDPDAPGVTPVALAIAQLLDMIAEHEALADAA